MSDAPHSQPILVEGNGGGSAAVSVNPSLESLVAEVADEFMERLDRGERPDVETYVRRYPHHASVLRQVLASLEMVRLSSGSGGTPPADSTEVLGTVGDFRILREVGRGGMGVVYEAEQLSLARRVALKVLPFAAALDTRQLQRFHNEATAAGQLHHQNIVPVHAVGAEHGVHYYAMQFIDGQNLATIIAELRHLSGLGAGTPARIASPAEAGETEDQIAGLLSTKDSTRSRTFFRTAARLGIQAAQALEHAHDQNVIHRDIKPANLIVDGRGNLWITDFGLARVKTDNRLTLTGDLLGTLRYMSPEQALGQRVVLDARTDIYSLGVTLYELLTLEPAFGGGDRQVLLRQIAFEEPKTPRRINPAIPVELETIALKAAAKNPAERYATARELADDLQRFLQDEPIRARRPTVWNRLARWTRRHRPMVVAAAVSLFVVLAFAVGLLLLSREQIRGALSKTEAALEREEQALEEKSKALGLEQIANRITAEALARETAALKAVREQERKAQQTLHTLRITLADREWWAGNVAGAEQLLEDCMPERRQWEWHYLKRLCHKELFTLRDRSEVRAVAYLASGTRLATANAGGVVKVWDLERRTESLSLDINGRRPLFSLAMTRDGTRMAWAGFNGVMVCDTRTGARLLDLPLRSFLGTPAVAISPDGERLAFGRAVGQVGVWEVRTGKQLLSLSPKGETAANLVVCVSFSPDGQRLAVGGERLRLWDAATGKELRLLKGHTDRVQAVAFSPDGRRLASAGFDQTIRLWDVDSGKELRTCHGHLGPVLAVAFSPGGERVASAGTDRAVKVWEAESGKEMLTFRGHQELVTSVAFHPEGRFLASGSMDHTVKFWDTSSLGQEALVLRGHAQQVHSLSFTPDSKRLASAAFATPASPLGLRVWDAETGKSRLTLPGRVTVCYSADGRQLISDDGKKVWDAGSGKELPAPLPGPGQFGPGGRPFRAAFASSDGKYCASAAGLPGKPGEVWIWETATGKEVRRFQDPAPVGTLIFSQDARFLASIDPYSGRFKVWETASGKVLLLHVSDKPVAICAVFSPDSRFLATGHGELTPREELKGALKLWDVQSGQLVRSFAGPSSQILSLSFSPDGKRLASGGRDAAVTIWIVSIGEPALTLRGHKDAVRCVLFSPNGCRLASAGEDRTVRIWDGTPLPPNPAPSGATP